MYASICINLLQLNVGCIHVCTGISRNTFQVGMIQGVVLPAGLHVLLMPAVASFEGLFYLSCTVLLCRFYLSISIFISIVLVFKLLLNEISLYLLVYAWLCRYCERAGIRSSVLDTD